MLGGRKIWQYKYLVLVLKLFPGISTLKCAIHNSGNTIEMQKSKFLRPLSAKRLSSFFSSSDATSIYFRLGGHFETVM